MPTSREAGTNKLSAEWTDALKQERSPCRTPDETRNKTRVAHGRSSLITGSSGPVTDTTRTPEANPQNGKRAPRTELISDRGVLPDCRGCIVALFAHDASDRTIA